MSRETTSDTTPSVIPSFTFTGVSCSPSVFQTVGPPVFGMLRFGARRTEPKRGIRDRKNFGLFGDNRRDIRRHPWLQLEIRVIDLDHGRIGDDVLDVLRRQPDLSDAAVERVRRVRVNREGHATVGAELANVCFIDVGKNLHAAEIVCDQKQRWSLEARCDGLSDVHIPRYDYAVDRSADNRVLEIDRSKLNGCSRLLRLCLRLIHLRPRRLDLGLGLIPLCNTLLVLSGSLSYGSLRRIQFAASRDTFIDELLREVKVALCVCEDGFRALDVELGCLSGCLGTQDCVLACLDRGVGAS